MSRASEFFSSVAGRSVTICGIGHNNIPVIRQFLEAGAHVTACDRRTAQELGEVADAPCRCGTVAGRRLP